MYVHVCMYPGANCSLTSRLDLSHVELARYAHSLFCVAYSHITIRVTWDLDITTFLNRFSA